MSFEHTVANLVKVVEGAGALVMVGGTVWAFAVAALALRGGARSPHTYEALRRNLGSSILLGLEVLIVADIVNTIVVTPTLDSVTVLGVIVVIRVVLSFSLEVEIDGVWPWARWRRDQAERDRRAPS
jgi:uncharacterized membrane protein